MFKSKKGQVLAFAVVFAILISVGLVLTGSFKGEKAIVGIGNKQINMLNAYAEAEKAREYVELSFYYSAKLAAQELTSLSNRNCFEGLDKETFKSLFEQNADRYLQAYKSTNRELNVSLPIYNYDFDFEDDKIIIYSIPSGPIFIQSNVIFFNYSATAQVRTELSCQ